LQTFRTVSEGEFSEVHIEDGAKISSLANLCLL
jgi:hypothetical protein